MVMQRDYRSRAFTEDELDSWTRDDARVSLFG
jgi:hypothetical protein